jgi:release factor glutamine methyltransferase
MAQGLLHYLKKAQEFLPPESAKFDSEELLMNVLGIEDRISLYLDFDKPLSEQEVAAYRQQLVRRKKGEPLQYITGESWFNGRKFKVAPGVLIPRLDTEFLMQIFIEKTRDYQDLTVIDVGTGSGILAINAALELPSIRIIATDISEPALEIARENARRFEVQERIEFVHSDLLEDLIHYDLNSDLFLVSNPPYIKLDDPHIEASVKEYEPAQALFARDNGLEYYKKIIQQSNFFEDNLKGIFFEVGFTQGQTVKNMLQSKYPEPVSILTDMTGKERVVYMLRE